MTMKKAGFRWEQSHIGGGGYITGILQHPNDYRILYARCDVAGIFKSNDCGKSWRTINRGLTLGYHHQTRSFAMDSQRPDILYRCSGEARGRQTCGAVHKSADGGETWAEVCGEVDFYGNGPTRYCGEVIAIDPFHDGTIVVGGYSRGVWISCDEGWHWEYAGLKDERITCVAFHPYFPGRIYVGTVSEKGLGEEGLNFDRLQDYDRKRPGRLFFSGDWGYSWELLHEGLDFSQFVFDRKEPNLMLASCLRNGIYKSKDAGHTWSPCRNGLVPDITYLTITADPHNTCLLYTIPDLRGMHTHVDPIAVYRSEDHGESWEMIKTHTDQDLKEYPDYMTVRHVGWAVSKLLVDQQNSSRIYLCNWFGVSISEDGGRTWAGNGFTGFETTCLENVVTDPAVAGNIYLTLADYAPKVSVDNGKTYRQLAGMEGFSNSTALVASKFQPGLLLYGLRNREKSGGCLVRSEDGGKTITPVITHSNDLVVQALAEDHFQAGVFYAYFDGTISEGAGLYTSHDWGRTWGNMNLPWPEHMRTLPHQKYWIEAELLSVTVYQVKNACGTNQLLAVDPHRPRTLCVGEWTEGLFLTMDQGQNWVNIGCSLPFLKNQSSVLNTVKFDPHRPGVIYAGFIREGLWRSTDYGERWDKVFPTDGSVVNASAVAIGDYRSGEIFIACEPLYWSPCVPAVYYSSDEGLDWRNIYDGQWGAVRWKGIAVERSTGTVHVVSCGNGCFYAERYE